MLLKRASRPGAGRSLYRRHREHLDGCSYRPFFIPFHAIIVPVARRAVSQLYIYNKYNKHTTTNLYFRDYLIIHQISKSQNEIRLSRLFVVSVSRSRHEIEIENFLLLLLHLLRGPVGSGVENLTAHRARSSRWSMVPHFTLITIMFLRFSSLSSYRFHNSYTPRFILFTISRITTSNRIIFYRYPANVISIIITLLHWIIICIHRCILVTKNPSAIP